MSKIYLQSQTDWQHLLAPTKKEIAAPSAQVIFVSQTTLKEKIQRIFNGVMFAVVAARCLVPLIPIPMALKSAILLPAVLKTALGKWIVPFALIIVIRKVLAVMINHVIYPAVLFSYGQKYDKERLSLFKNLENDHVVQRLTLSHSGYNYDAFTFSQPGDINQNHWMIIAGGNGVIGECELSYLVRKFKDLKMNFLFVNGPGVARSQGFPTSYSIVAGQRAGLQFLETIVKAKKIVFYGYSLGGAAQLEALTQYPLKSTSKYLVWSDRTFDSLANTASAIVTRWANPLFFILGIKLDSLPGARKLQSLNIPHLVTQNNRDPLSYEGVINTEGSDGVLPNRISLYVGLRKEGIVDQERIKFYGHRHLNHNGDGFFPEVIKDIQNFLRQEEV